MSEVYSNCDGVGRSEVFRAAVVPAVGHDTHMALLLNGGGRNGGMSNPGYEQLGCEEGKDQTS